MTDLCNIARHLPLMAGLHPEVAAIKIPRGHLRSGEIDYLTLSFAELEAEAAAWQIRLAKAGLRQGDRTLVMVRPGLPLIASVFALFASGAVPIVIDPGMGLRHFLSCVARSKPRALVGIPLAQILSRFAFRAFRGLELRIGASARLDARLTAPFRPGQPAQSFRLQQAPTQASDLAAILFTSGSTGAPKGVCYEHGMFEAQIRLLKANFDIQPGEIDLPLLPIFALFNPALGMTTIVPEIDPRRPASIDAARIVQAIQQEQVTTSFGSPTLWRIIADHCLANGITLPSLRRVFCAGAPVPTGLWTDSVRLLPAGRMHSPYGATEALPVSSVSSKEVDFTSLRGAHVGKPMEGVEVRIIQLNDAPIASISKTQSLPVGQIGEIIVRGSVVTRRYDALTEATIAAKIPGASGELWHRMGDAGFLDEQGHLWFCGRKAERVRTSDSTLFTEPCERVFRQHPRARRCALIGLGEPGRQRPALVVETVVKDSEEARTLARVLRALAAQHPHTAGIKLFYFHKRFPVDVRHNAKIHRLALSRWARAAKGFESDPKR